MQRQRSAAPLSTLQSDKSWHLFLVTLLNEVIRRYGHLMLIDIGKDSK